MADYLSYWTPQNARHDEGSTFDCAWNSRYDKVKPGDVLWMVTAENNSLFLLARGVVSKAMTQRDAKKDPFFKEKVNWPSEAESGWEKYWVIIAEPRSIIKWRDITDVATQLRFESKSNPTLYETPAKWGNALQTLRTLTPESAKLLQARLKVSVGGVISNPSDEPETPEEAIARIEGREILHSHLRRERLAYFRDRKLQESMKPYRCEACDMTFEGRYGEIGKDFIEVHHKTAIADGERETKLEDLALLCSNCHRMIHKGGNLSDIESFRTKHLKSFKTQST
jgi:predicted HNH restriction endonuclease